MHITHVDRGYGEIWCDDEYLEWSRNQPIITKYTGITATRKAKLLKRWGVAMGISCAVMVVLFIAALICCMVNALGACLILIGIIFVNIIIHQAVIIDNWFWLNEAVGCPENTPVTPAPVETCKKHGIKYKLFCDQCYDEKYHK